MIDTTSRRRVGMLTPSSNTVLEPVTQSLLAGTPRFTAHFSRFKVTEIALDGPALAQFDDSAILRAAELLAHAKVDVIAWNGTSAGWLGIERDVRLKERIEAATGIRASTCVLALRDILTRLSARTQALVTPYTDDVQAAIIETFARAGVTCPVERHLRIRDNFTFGTVSEDVLRPMIADCLARQPEVVTIFCTNLNGARLAAEMEPASGPLILDSVAITLWGALMAIGEAANQIAGFGRLFSDPRLQSSASA